MKLLNAIRNKIRQVKEAKDQFVRDYKYIQMLEEKYKDSKHLSPKELMEKETEWECLEILALEDLYTVRHMRGKKYGLESYFVMLGGTILSRHDNEKDAMEQFDARLAGEFLLFVDPIDDWD